MAEVDGGRGVKNDELITITKFQKIQQNPFCEGVNKRENLSWRILPFPVKSIDRQRFIRSKKDFG